jgi:hypothetical protein
MEKKPPIGMQHISAFAEFVACERKHYEQALKHCPSLQLSLDITLNNFCSQLHDYSSCYSQVPFHCSEKATEVRGSRLLREIRVQIWLRINHSIMRSYNLLLELSSEHLKLPYKCQWAVSLSPSIYVSSPTEAAFSTDVYPTQILRKGLYDADVMEDSTIPSVSSEDDTSKWSESTADYWDDIEQVSLSSTVEKEVSDEEERIISTATTTTVLSTTNRNRLLSTTTNRINQLPLNASISKKCLSPNLLYLCVSFILLLPLI